MASKSNHKPRRHNAQVDGKKDEKHATNFENGSSARSPLNRNPNRIRTPIQIGNQRHSHFDFLTLSFPAAEQNGKRNGLIFVYAAPD